MRESKKAASEVGRKLEIVIAQKPTKDSVSSSKEQSVVPNAGYCSVKRRAKN